MFDFDDIADGAKKIKKSVVNTVSDTKKAVSDGYDAAKKRVDQATRDISEAGEVVKKKVEKVGSDISKKIDSGKKKVDVTTK